MRIVIFGANGQTGRLLTGQALAAGHDVAAVTRRPAEFPIDHDRLTVVEADVHDAPSVDRAADGGFMLNRVLQPLVTATIGKTTYADMRRMERLVRGSGLDWTIMRPSGLFDAPGVTAYELHEDQAPGIFTSRAGLAASVLEQATDTRFVRKAAAVTTSEGIPTLFQMMRREALKKK